MEDANPFNVKFVIKGDEFEAEYRRVRPILLDALFHGGRATSEVSLLTKLENNEAYLWTCTNSVFVVAIIDNDFYRSCFVWLTAGNREELLDHALPRLKEWARSHGCTKLEMNGRIGWLKVLPKYGFKPVSATQTIDL